VRWLACAMVGVRGVPGGGGWHEGVGGGDVCAGALRDSATAMQRQQQQRQQHGSSAAAAPAHLHSHLVLIQREHLAHGVGGQLGQQQARGGAVARE
jgi:hypothetical protein